MEHRHLLHFAGMKKDRFSCDTNLELGNFHVEIILNAMQIVVSSHSGNLSTIHRTLLVRVDLV